jgi:argininosuccinate synthase
MNRVDMVNERVGLLVSGGLSCIAVAAYLGECGMNVTCYVADIGQPGGLTARRVTELLSARGFHARLVDLRTLMAERCVDLVRYQATYEGGYWNTTGASREVLVAGLAETLRADGCTVLAHGCVGGGNDQRRFARYTAELAPGLRVFEPWTTDWMLERFPDRASMARYLGALGFPEEVTGLAGYSVDGNLGGCSHESLELESLHTPAMGHITPLMTVWPRQAAAEAEAFAVEFSDGRPVSIGGDAVTPVEAISRASAVGGRCGVAPLSVVENRVNGTKCRGVYEAPGLELLGRCLGFLYQASLDKPAASLLRSLSAVLGTAVYEGRVHDRSATAARAAVDVLAAAANGNVEVEVYRGNILLRRIDDSTVTSRQTRFGSGGHQWRTEVALLRPPCRFPVPPVLAKPGQQVGRQGLPVAHRQVRPDVRAAPHPGNHGRDRWMVQDEPEREFRQRHARRHEFGHPRRSWHALQQVLRHEVRVTPVPVWPARALGQRSGQRALVERNPGDDGDAGGLAGTEELVFR